MAELMCRIRILTPFRLNGYVAFARIPVEYQFLFTESRVIGVFFT